MFGHSDKMLLRGREGRKTERWLQNWQLLLAVTTSCESRGMKWWHNLWTGCFMCWHANGDSPRTTQYQRTEVFWFSFIQNCCFFSKILFTHLTTKPSAQQCFPWFSKRLVGLCTLTQALTFLSAQLQSAARYFRTASSIVFFLTLPDFRHAFLRRGQECARGDAWVVLRTYSNVLFFFASFKAEQLHIQLVFNNALCIHRITPPPITWVWK